MRTLFLFIFLLSIFPAVTVDRDEYLIIMIFSYGPNYGNNEDTVHGLMEGLIMNSIVEGYNLEVVKYYVDSKGKDQEEVNEVCEGIFGKIWDKYENDYQLLVLLDDDVIDYYAEYVDQEDFPPSKMVYTGMNNSPYRENVQHFYGIFEPTYLSEAVSIFDNAVNGPDSLNNKIVKVLFDNTTSGFLKEYALQWEKAWSTTMGVYDILLGGEVEHVTLATYEDLENEIKSISKNKDVRMIYYAVGTLRRDNRELDPEECVAAFIDLYEQHQIYHTVEFASSKSQTAYGLLGGLVVDFVNMGERASMLATRIIRGIPMTNATEFYDLPWCKIYWNQDRMDNLTENGVIKDFPESLTKNAAYIYKTEEIPQAFVESPPNYIPLIITISIILVFLSYSCCGICCVSVYVVIKYFRDLRSLRDVKNKKKEADDEEMGEFDDEKLLLEELGEPMIGGASSDDDDRGDDDDGIEGYNSEENVGDIDDDDDVGDLDTDDDDEDGGGGGEVKRMSHVPDMSDDEENVGDMSDDDDGGDQYFRVD